MPILHTGGGCVSICFTCVHWNTSHWDTRGVDVCPIWGWLACVLCSFHEVVIVCLHLMGIYSCLCANFIQYIHEHHITSFMKHINKQFNPDIARNTFAMYCLYTIMLSCQWTDPASEFTQCLIRLRCALPSVLATFRALGTTVSSRFLPRLHAPGTRLPRRSLSTNWFCMCG